MTDGAANVGTAAVVGGRAGGTGGTVVSRWRRPIQPGAAAPGWLRLSLAATVLLAVAVAHGLLARGLRVPIIYGDELGYLDNARYLMHGGPRPALTYYPGLSLLLVPAWALTTDALAVWRSAQAVNCVAAIVTLLEVVKLGGVCGLGRVSRWLVAVAVAVYPPALLYSDVALSESLFQAVFVGVVLLVAAAASRRSSGVRWATAGMAAAALTLVHPRGLAVAIALVLVAALVLRPRPGHGAPGEPARRAGEPAQRALPTGRLAALSLAAGLVLGFALMRIALVATRAQNVVTRPDYQAGAVVGRTLTQHSIGQLLIGLFGRAFYLSIATVGLAPFGIALGVIAFIAVAKGDRTPLRVIHAFVGAAGLGVIALSVLLVNGGTRSDELVHGRYVDGVVIPLIAIALAELVVDPARRWKGWVATGTVTLLVSGGVLAAEGQLENLSGELNAINILGIEPLLRRLDADSLRVLPLLLVGLAGIVAGGLIARRAPRVAVLTLAVAFTVSAIDTQLHYLAPGSDAKARQTVLVNAIRHASSRLGVAPSCVSYDGEPDFNYFADRLLLGTQRLQAINPGDRACGAFVITARPAFENRFPGSRLVLEEDDVDEDLYVLAGDAEKALADAGWLLPNKTPGPLPLGQAAHIATGAPPTHVRAGSAAKVKAKVTVASAVTPWPALRGIEQGPYAVRVAVRWFAPGQQPSSPGEPGTPVTSTAVELPRSLLPGDTTAVTLPLVARLPDGRPLPPAQYRVRIAVYQELQGAFAGAIDLNVRVTR